MIDEYLRNEIEVHLIGNLVMEPAPGPLILGIFGPPGEGKTHHCEEVSHHLGVRLLRIGPGELESEHAGHPAQVIRREYVRAGALEEPSALIINDVDTVLGDWGPLVQYTVNRQVVVSQLMNLCDYPTEVSGNNTARVPIIVTGNNPSSMHGPLMRRGRVRVVAYEPTQEQRVAVVATLFPWLEQHDVEKLFAVARSEPVSFWVELRDRVAHASLVAAIRGSARRPLLTALASRQRMEASYARPNLSELQAEAWRMVSEAVRHTDYTNGSAMVRVRPNG